MFHVEQSLALPAALFCMSAAAEQAYNPLPLSTDSEPAALECNLGLQNTLMGYHERALHHFSRALEHDETCVPARCGRILLNKDAQDYTQRLNELETLLQTYTPTPAEALFINSLLKLACNEVNGAAADFRHQAEQHPNDIAAACWAISLMHLAGNAHDAALLADRALERHPSEVMLLYMRAAMEDTADNVSDQALFCAQAAAILMRDSAQAELLYGKLLFKRGFMVQAAAHFHVAQKWALRDMQESGGTCSYTYLAAELNRATALWCCGRDQEALDARRKMNAETFSTYSPDAAALHRWEISTLPLRTLVNSENVSSSGIRAALKEANASPTDDSLYQYYIQALQECLQARCEHNKFQSEALIASAKLMLKRMNDAPARSGIHTIVLQRAKFAVAQAIAAAQTHLYKDSGWEWYDNLDTPRDAPGRFLPPIVPERSIVPRGTK